MLSSQGSITKNSKNQSKGSKEEEIKKPSPPLKAVKIKSSSRLK